MGACLCKDKSQPESSSSSSLSHHHHSLNHNQQHQDHDNHTIKNGRPQASTSSFASQLRSHFRTRNQHHSNSRIRRRGRGSSQQDFTDFYNELEYRGSTTGVPGSRAHGGGGSPGSNCTISKLINYIDELVLETLAAIRTLVDNEQDPPSSMLKLHLFAEKEKGWIILITSLINAIPMDDPLGPAVILLLLDDCPLPTKESISRLSSELDLLRNGDPHNAFRGKETSAKFRNLSIIFGCLAEKLAGPNAISLFTDQVIYYLMNNLNPTNGHHPAVILFSLLALEKFAQTSENKLVIIERLSKGGRENNPLLQLEQWIEDSDYMKRQVGFCAQWSLDNLFIVEGRRFTYETIDRTNLNALLNSNDVSEYLKISAEGLMARCDASSFESVRCTFPVTSGIWYYEATLITCGVMQIGWATKDSKFMNHEGYGIGDDECSLAYDGCRQLIWYNASCTPHKQPCWQPGDVLGCLLDLNAYEIYFYLNGKPLGPFTQVFKNAKAGFFAAASFMSFQQADFNFGRRPFRYPPKNRSYDCFNDKASLSDRDKLVIPKHIKLKQLQNCSLKDDSCSICCDLAATIQLDPCGHRGFCSSCALQLEFCPLCRSPIDQRKVVSVSPTSPLKEELSNPIVTNDTFSDRGTNLESVTPILNGSSKDSLP